MATIFRLVYISNEIWMAFHIDDVNDYILWMNLLIFALAEKRAVWFDESPWFS